MIYLVKKESKHGVDVIPCANESIAKAYAGIEAIEAMMRTGFLERSCQGGYLHNGEELPEGEAEFWEAIQEDIYRGRWWPTALYIEIEETHIREEL